jgi:hypothetical protein
MYHWPYAGPLRLCPACLGQIQRQYGGAWKLLCRLPIGFAYVKHGVFLSEGYGAAGRLPFAAS